jgi:hypothetical protein
MTKCIVSKYTPGPWHVGFDNQILDPLRGTGWTTEGVPVVHVCSSETGQVIAFVSAREFAGFIAAAPELLEALKALQANPNDPRAHRKALDSIKKAGAA